MLTRTHLTTPPGGTPTTEASGRGQDELYTPGLARPVEPRPASRFRTLFIVLGIVAFVLVAAWIAFRLATSGQDFDPSLDQNAPGAPAEEFDPSIPLPDESG